MTDHQSEYRYVDDLPDLITPDEYGDHPTGGLVRIQISVQDGAVEVLGDAMRPDVLEKLLEQLGPEVIEQMLCG
jgi:hypothetical protein